MANPYAALFQVQGARAFVLAGMLARMPVSMTGIGLITMLAQVHGGYGLAGSVAAVFALATAICAPQVSRLVDRYSQGRVLPIAALIGGGALLMLLLCTRLQAPTWTLFVFRAGRLHAEHVGDGARTLDRDLSRPAAIADCLCAGIGAR